MAGIGPIEFRITLHHLAEGSTTEHLSIRAGALTRTDIEQILAFLQQHSAYIEGQDRADLARLNKRIVSAYPEMAERVEGVFSTIFGAIEVPRSPIVHRLAICYEEKIGGDTGSAVATALNQALSLHLPTLTTTALIRFRERLPKSAAVFTQNQGGLLFICPEGIDPASVGINLEAFSLFKGEEEIPYKRVEMVHDLEEALEIQKGESPVYRMVYMVGHGMMEAASGRARIGGLDVNEFQQTLAILDDHNMAFFMLDSCFSGGENLSSITLPSGLVSCPTLVRNSMETPSTFAILSNSAFRMLPGVFDKAEQALFAPSPDGLYPNTPHALDLNSFREISAAGHLLKRSGIEAYHFNMQTLQNMHTLLFPTGNTAFAHTAFLGVEPHFLLDVDRRLGKGKIIDFNPDTAHLFFSKPIVSTTLCNHVRTGTVGLLARGGDSLHLIDRIELPRVSRNSIFSATLNGVLRCAANFPHRPLGANKLFVIKSLICCEEERDERIELKDVVIAQLRHQPVIFYMTPKSGRHQLSVSQGHSTKLFDLSMRCEIEDDCVIEEEEFERQLYEAVMHCLPSKKHLCATGAEEVDYADLVDHLQQMVYQNKSSRYGQLYGCAIAGGSIINALAAIPEEGRKEATRQAFYLAIGAGNDAGVVELLDHGIDPTLRFESGETALHMAVQHSNHALVKELIGRMDTVDLPDAKGRTPLHLAVIYNNRSAFERLLPRSNLDAQDNVGANPLYYAVLGAKIDLIPNLFQDSVHTLPDDQVKKKLIHLIIEEATLLDTLVEKELLKLEDPIYEQLTLLGYLIQNRHAFSHFMAIPEGLKATYACVDYQRGYNVAEAALLLPRRFWKEIREANGPIREEKRVEISQELLQRIKESSAEELAQLTRGLQGIDPPFLPVEAWAEYLTSLYQDEKELNIGERILISKLEEAGIRSTIDEIERKGSDAEMLLGLLKKNKPFYAATLLEKGLLDPDPLSLDTIQVYRKIRSWEKRLQLAMEAKGIPARYLEQERENIAQLVVDLRVSLAQLEKQELVLSQAELTKLFDTILDPPCYVSSERLDDWLKELSERLEDFQERANGALAQCIGKLMRQDASNARFSSGNFTNLLSYASITATPEELNQLIVLFVKHNKWLEIESLKEKGYSYDFSLEGAHKLLEEALLFDPTFSSYRVLEGLGVDGKMPWAIDFFHRCLHEERTHEIARGLFLCGVTLSPERMHECYWNSAVMKIDNITSLGSAISEQFPVDSRGKEAREALASAIDRGNYSLVTKLLDERVVLDKEPRKRLAKRFLDALREGGEEVSQIIEALKGHPETMKDAFGVLDITPFVVQHLETPDNIPLAALNFLLAGGASVRVNDSIVHAAFSQLFQNRNLIQNSDLLLLEAIGFDFQAHQEEIRDAVQRWFADKGIMAQLTFKAIEFLKRTYHIAAYPFDSPYSSTSSALSFLSSLRDMGIEISLPRYLEVLADHFKEGLTLEDIVHCRRLGHDLSPYSDMIMENFAKSPDIERASALIDAGLERELFQEFLTDQLTPDLLFSGDAERIFGEEVWQRQDMIEMMQKVLDSAEFYHQKGALWKLRLARAKGIVPHPERLRWPFSRAIFHDARLGRELLELGILPSEEERDVIVQQLISFDDLITAKMVRELSST